MVMKCSKITVFVNFATLHNRILSYFATFDKGIDFVNMVRFFATNGLPYSSLLIEKYADNLYTLFFIL